MSAKNAEQPGHFLFKTEPGDYPYERLARDGKAAWDGVTNPLALRHLARVLPGADVLIYHTGDVRSVVGLARATSAPYPDPKAGDTKRLVVDLAPVRALPRPVTLATIKADPRFRDFELVRMGRLSVMPVPDDLFRAILELAGDRG